MLCLHEIVSRPLVQDRARDRSIAQPPTSRQRPCKRWQREIVAQRAMIIPVNDAMNSAVNPERSDVENQTLPKVSTEASLLRLIERESIDKVVLRLVQNLNYHEVRSRIRFFADSQSENFASPASICRCRSSSISFCQSATGIFRSFRHRSSQSISIALSFSSTVIRSNGRTASTASIINHQQSTINILRCATSRRQQLRNRAAATCEW